MQKLLLFMIAIILMASATAAPLAIVESDYMQFQPNITGPAWSIHLRGDNSADYINFIENASIVGDINGTAAQAQHSFTLQSTITSESCNYALTDNPTKTDIFEWQLIQEADNIKSGDVEAVFTRCQAKDGLEFGFTDKEWVIGLPPVRFDVYCLYKNKVASVGDVSEGTMNFQAKFTLSKDTGETLTSTISTLAKSTTGIPPVVYFKGTDGKTVALIKWVGGVTYGEFCPSQDHVVAVQQENTWFTANKDRYTEYMVAYTNFKDYLTDFENTYVENNEVPTKVRQDLQSKVNTMNERSLAASTPAIISSGNNIATVKGSTSILDLPRDYLIYAPDFQIFIWADWLKVTYLIGKPKITAAEFTKCAEGATDNTIDVTLQNVGLASGKFEAGIKCESAVNIQATQRSITLQPGESGTLSFPFTASVEKDTKVNCLVTVTDSNYPSFKVSKSISSTCTSTEFCTVENQLICRYSTQYKCVSGNWIAQKNSTACQKNTCNNNGVCEAASGESFENCGGIIAAQNDCATCNFDGVCDATESVYSCPEDCEEKLSSSTWLIIGILTAFLIFAGYVYMKTNKKGRRK
jgi:hypothetical protein